ncbi:MAG: glutaminase A [Bacillota bacterium]|nr:glutaminase A [Bacillota bacterium]
MDLEKIVQETYAYGENFLDQGSLVDYIPGLDQVDPRAYGLALIDQQGKIYQAGSIDKSYTMMSIVKVFLYILALEAYDFAEIRKYIGLKPSSKAFNSLLDLQAEDNIPVNPYVNAGALTTCFLLYKKYGDSAVDLILEKISSLADNPKIAIDQEVVRASSHAGYANKAMIFSLQNKGPISKDVDVFKILDIYNQACSIAVSTKDLAKLSYILSNNGKNPKGDQVIAKDHARISRTLMALCGTYDYSGDFAIDVGLGAKSGVGGGIMTSTNCGLGLATYGPKLDARGNSIVGIEMLKYISERLELKIY